MSKKRRKSSDQGGGGGDGGFMQMFVTLSLILLAFFILLNSMATMDRTRTKEALGSLMGTFGLLPGASSVEQSGDETIDQKGILGSPEVKLLFNEAKKEIERLVKHQIAADTEVELSFDDETKEIKIVMADRVLFPAGEAVISPRLFPLLDHVADIAATSKGVTRVVGHTDDRPSRTKSNWQLSLERGAIVARHLQSSGHLDENLIRAAGAAEYEPRSENDTEDGLSANRRVEIFVKTIPEE